MARSSRRGDGPDWKCRKEFTLAQSRGRTFAFERIATTAGRQMNCILCGPHGRTNLTSSQCFLISSSAATFTGRSQRQMFTLRTISGGNPLFHAVTGRTLKTQRAMSEYGARCAQPWSLIQMEAQAPWDHPSRGLGLPISARVSFHDKRICPSHRGEGQESDFPSALERYCKQRSVGPTVRI
jgi:hypothetical protein